MSPELLLSRHAWAVFLAAFVVFACALWFVARRRMQERPDLAPGYRKLFLGYLIVCSAPWLIMGVGIELGGVPGIPSFMRAPGGDPFVLAVHASVVACWVALLYWVVFRGGAEFLSRHSGLFNAGANPSPAKVRLAVCLMVLGGILGMLMCYAGFLDLPNGRFPPPSR